MQTIQKADGAIPKSIFVLFYGVTSFLLPMVFFFLGAMWSVIFYASDFVFSLIPLGIVVCLLAFVLYKAMRNQLRFMHFWLLSLILFTFSYSLFFMVDLMFEHQKLLLSLLTIVLIGCIAYITTTAWDEIFNKRKFNKAYLLLIPLISNIFLIRKDIFIPFGQWLNELTHQSINIFFLDWGGFLILYLNTINALIVWLLFKITNANTLVNKKY